MNKTDSTFTAFGSFARDFARKEVLPSKTSPGNKNKRLKTERDVEQKAERVVLGVLEHVQSNPLVTPPSSPSKDQPTTPTKRIRAIIPSTPFKSKAQKRKRSLFAGELPSQMTNLHLLFPELTKIPIPYHSITSYQEPSTSHSHILVKQEANKDCGGAAALMLLTDLATSVPKSVVFKPIFVDWLSRAYLYDGDQMTMGLSLAIDAEIKPRHGKIPMEDPLSFIQKKLTETGLPVITAISHPTVGGHWIVVDRITDSFVYIRDPYAGKAYQIPPPEMKKYFDTELEEEIVFLERNSELLF